MKSLNLTLITGVLALIASISLTTQASTIAGWPADSALVFEPIHGFGWKKSYAQLENGNCALAAKAYQSPGQQAVVVLTKVNSENAPAACANAGKVYGVYFNCSGEQTQEHKAVGHSAICSRQLGLDTYEQIMINGFNQDLRLIQRSAGNTRNKYLNFYNSRKSL